MRLTCLLIVQILTVSLDYFATASITLTVSPSGPVEVNQRVTLQCSFENFPISALFYTTANETQFCTLEAESSGQCKSVACSSNYTATCLNNKAYRLVYPVPRSWNGKGVYCKGTLTGDQESNQVNFSVIVLVTSVTLTPTQITVDAGKQIPLTCQTDYCNPAASITWYKASNILTTPTTDTTDTDSNGLVRTTSVLQYSGVAGDNGQEVYCRASNRPGKNMDSNKYTLDVKYPPSSDPVITASPPGLQYKHGTSVTLTCQLSGGNPVATLSWRCKNTDVVGTNGSNSATAVSALSLVMNSSYNNQQCTCTANHRLLTSPTSTSVPLTVFYPPSSDPVITASPQGLQYNNGTRVNLTCQLSGGNPVATLSWRCKNTDVVGTNGSNSTTAVSVLSLVMDSSYNNQQCTCTANHSLLTSPKSRSVLLTVFYNNVITSNWNQTYSIEEHERFQLVCEVDGNPLSNITWVFVRNNSVIENIHNVTKSLLEISSANCLDYGTYEVLADNGMGPSAGKTANLSVNCKPRLYTTDSLTSTKIGIGNNDSLQIFVRILLFPPATHTTWSFSRKTNESKVIRDSVDGYRITHMNGNVEQNTTLYKKTVNTEEFGNYTLRVENEVGIFTRIYYVDSARSPLIPTNITLLCENSMSIKLSWISNFNGGDDQSFQISYSTDGYLTESYKVLKMNIDDKGNGRPHSYIPSIELQGSLWFTITASNKFGNSTSDATHCNAVKISEDSPSKLPVIAGAATGGLVFAGLIIFGIVFFLRTMKESKGKKKGIPKRNEERESDEDDGLKENALYISAGPKDDEKPGVSGTAVYAEVNKKGLASDSNANVYAEVQKSGKAASDKVALYSDTTKPKKGLFKKEEKPKQKKAKKMKQKKEVADVYENAEDIAMTQNLDNVYSNTTESNGTKSENHGYKNQDGLLYVEVQFDQKQGNGKPVIHGEDEKTDYATVEFPFPPSSNNPQDEK